VIIFDSIWQRFHELVTRRRASASKLVVFLVVALVSAAVATLLFQRTVGTHRSGRTILWAPAPCELLPVYSKNSELIVMGRVIARSVLSPLPDGTPDYAMMPNSTLYYNITLDVERVLKGPSLDIVTIMVRQEVDEKLHWTYRPEIGVGETLILPFLFRVKPDADNWYCIGYECASEYHIWRVRNERVYNKMGLERRDPRMPKSLEEKWQQDFSIEEFVATIMGAIGR